MTTTRQPRVLGTSKYKCCPQAHFIYPPRMASGPASTAKPRGTSGDPFQLQDPGVGTTWGPHALRVVEPCPRTDRPPNDVERV
jgi:hypothetical protein